MVWVSGVLKNLRVGEDEGALRNSGRPGALEAFEGGIAEIHHAEECTASLWPCAIGAEGFLKAPNMHQRTCTNQWASTTHKGGIKTDGFSLNSHLKDRNQGKSSQNAHLGFPEWLSRNSLDRPFSWRSPILWQESPEFSGIFRHLVFGVPKSRFRGSSLKTVTSLNKESRLHKFHFS